MYFSKITWRGTPDESMLCPEANTVPPEVRNDFIAPTEAECQNNAPQTPAPTGYEAWTVNRWMNDVQPPGTQKCAPEGGGAWTDIPAILGFGNAIHRQCNNLVFKPDGTYDDDTRGGCCMKNGHYYNRLWVLGTFTPCINMKWIFCAAQGFLPGQRRTPEGGKIFLTHDVAGKPTFPEALEIGPADTHEHGITVNEVCLLDFICTNTNDLWNAPNNAEFTCHYDRSKNFKNLIGTAGAEMEVSDRAEIEVSDTLLISDLLDGKLNHHVIYIFFCALAILTTLYNFFPPKDAKDSIERHLLEDSEL